MTTKNMQNDVDAAWQAFKDLVKSKKLGYKAMPFETLASEIEQIIRHYCEDDAYEINALLRAATSKKNECQTYLRFFTLDRDEIIDWVKQHNTELEKLGDEQTSSYYDEFIYQAANLCDMITQRQEFYASLLEKTAETLQDKSRIISINNLIEIGKDTVELANRRASFKNIVGGGKAAREWLFNFDETQIISAGKYKECQVAIKKAAQKLDEMAIILKMLNHNIGTDFADLQILYHECDKKRQFHQRPKTACIPR